MSTQVTQRSNIETEAFVGLLRAQASTVQCFNAELVAAQRAEAHELEELRLLVERHVRHTGSTRAAELLADWAESAKLFWRVAPRTDAAVRQDAAEGTVATAAP